MFLLRGLAASARRSILSSPMHRRGLQCLPDLTGRCSTSVLSSLPEASGSRRHYAFLPKCKPPRNYPDVPHAQIAQWPDRLIENAASKKDKKGWRRDESMSGEAHRFTTAVKNTARINSTEKTKFFSAPSADDEFVDLRLQGADAGRRIQPGTFVEVRR